MKNSERVAVSLMSRNTEDEQSVRCVKIEMLWKKVKGGSYYICRYEAQKRWCPGETKRA